MRRNWRLCLLLAVVLGPMALGLTTCRPLELDDVEVTLDDQTQVFINQQRCYSGQLEFCHCTEESPPRSDDEAAYCEANIPAP